MTINEIVKDVHQNAVNHGWWDGKERTLPEILMLCVSELAEGLEAYRRNQPAFYCASESMDCDSRRATDEVCINDPEYKTTCEKCTAKDVKPEGWAVEMADCIIRIMDYFGHKGIDLEAIIKIKHEYNRTRPYRHGGKVL